MNSILICPDPVKYVKFEVMNHSSSLKFKGGPAPLCQAGAGSSVCTSLAQNLMGCSCRRAEKVQAMLGKEAGRSRAEEGNEGEEQLSQDREDMADVCHCSCHFPILPPVSASESCIAQVTGMVLSKDFALKWHENRRCWTLAHLRVLSGLPWWGAT